jgi:flagellar basal-body rod protein FlgB
VTSDYTEQVISKLLDLTANRHRVLSNNIANVNTPGFRRQDLEFGTALREATQEGSAALKALQVSAREDESVPVRLDGNSVQLEMELAEMSKNLLLHQMALQLMGARLQLQRTAITGRSV